MVVVGCWWGWFRYRFLFLLPGLLCPLCPLCLHHPPPLPRLPHRPLHFPEYTRLPHLYHLPHLSHLHLIVCLTMQVVAEASLVEAAHVSPVAEARLNVNNSLNCRVRKLY